MAVMQQMSSAGNPYKPSVTSSASSGPLQMMRCDVVISQVGVKTDSTDRLATMCDNVDG